LSLATGVELLVSGAGNHEPEASVVLQLQETAVDIVHGGIVAQGARAARRAGFRVGVARAADGHVVLAEVRHMSSSPQKIQQASVRSCGTLRRARHSVIDIVLIMLIIVKGNILT